MAGIKFEVHLNATSKDLRYHTKAVLKAVAAGKQVIITHRGVPKAIIRAIEGTHPPLAEDGADSVAGMWSDREDIADVDAHVRHRCEAISRLTAPLQAV